MIIVEIHIYSEDGKTRERARSVVDSKKEISYAISSLHIMLMEKLGLLKNKAGFSAPLTDNR